MLALLGTIRFLKLQYDIQIAMSDKTVKPILLYGSEIWGNSDITERFELKFWKHIFKLKWPTPNYMVYGELSIFRINIKRKARILLFWAILIENLKFDDLDIKLSSLIYVVICILYTQSNPMSDWISQVKSLFCDLGNISCATELSKNLFFITRGLILILMSAALYGSCRLC